MQFKKIKNFKYITYLRIMSDFLLSDISCILANYKTYYVLQGGVTDQADESIFDEGMWFYCLRCGVMFNPVKEAFAV